MEKARKRTKIEIEAEILAEAREEATKTHLVYTCNLNFQVIRPHLQELLDAELLEQIGAKYKITRRGIRYMIAYKVLDGIRRGSKLTNVFSEELEA